MPDNMSKRNFFYKLPPEYRYIARKIYYFPIDFYEKITGKRGKGVPSRGEIFIGSGDFEKQGQHQVELLKKYASLKPDDKVLDVGSGIGRTALALTNYLNTNGKYEGFDVVKKGVDWCNKNISNKFPNFNFKFVPLNNELYNSYSEKAVDFKFPYENEKFQKVYLFSVFTHMKIEDIKNYISEIHRVLEKDGICLATFFIYEKDADLMQFPGFKFPVLKDRYRLIDDKVEEANIAIEKDYLTEIINETGLEVVDYVKGFWSDFGLDRNGIDFQDIAIMRKV